jgi:hypothetical protein
LPEHDHLDIHRAFLMGAVAMLLSDSNFGRRYHVGLQVDEAGNPTNVIEIVDGESPAKFKLTLERTHG